MNIANFMYYGKTRIARNVNSLLDLSNAYRENQNIFKNFPDERKLKGLYGTPNKILTGALKSPRYFHLFFLLTHPLKSLNPSSFRPRSHANRFNQVLNLTIKI